MTNCGAEEMRTMNPKSLRPARRLSVHRVLLALLAAGAVTAGAVQLGASGGDGELPTNVTRVGFSSVADFSDDRRLAGFAEDVFSAG
jgi:hypothetical protein